MKQQAIIRLIVLSIALLNQILVTMGWHPLPFSDEDIYEALTAGFTIGAAVVAWWKNNNVTDNAKQAQLYLEKLNEQDKIREGR